MSQTMLSEEERHRLIVEWNATDTPYPRDATAHSLFEAQVEKTPEAIAVRFQQMQWTYRELNTRANHLARYLQRLNVGPDVLVGVCLERSLEMIAAIFGVLKAGGAYVPLDPRLPSVRLDFLLQDARPRLVVSAGRPASLLQGRGFEVVSLDAVFDGAPESETALSLSLSSDNLAYVIYTSGSTGQPKGVEVPHAPLVNFLLWAKGAFELSPADRVLQFAPFHFDTAGEEIFPCLAAGATLVLRTDQIIESPAAFLRRCGEAGITILDLPTAFWHEVVPALERGDAELPEGLRLVVIGGESALSERLAQWRRVVGRRVRLMNTYGPTETTVASTAADLTPEAHPRESLERSVPIGRPIANTRIYLLDAERQPVPVGVAGELYIGGEGVARGYLNRPDLTAERFISDPFGKPGSRMYKTGDLARCRADGSLEFLGRLDDQVKIRGYRIELGEIESVLSSHPAVQTAVVAAREREPGVRFLVAYVVAHDPTVRFRELRAFLRDRLPEYMVPSAFVRLSAVPLNPSGKVDRRALPPPTFPLAEADEEYVAPRDGVELRLSKLWEKTLSLPRVGVKDDFFDLGGDSLSAARLAMQVERVLGLRMSPASLIEAPTIERLAQILDEDQKPSRWTSLVPIQVGGSLLPLFCMHAGAGTILFYHDLARELGSDQPVYALQAQGLYGLHPPHSTVEEMAEHYIQEMRTVQPEGPYALAGFCFGAILAFEMAHQLLTQGQDVRLLASFDGPAPHYDYSADPSQSPPKPLGTRFSVLWSRFTTLAPREKATFVLKKLGNQWIDRTMNTQYRIGEFFRSKGLPVPVKIRRVYFLANHWEAERKYVPKVYPGPMIVFRSEGVFHDPKLGWESLIAGSLQIHSVPGEIRGHRDLMTGEFVRELSPRLRSLLRGPDRNLGGVSAFGAAERVEAKAVEATPQA